MTERFTLLNELGRGGMGVVWKARDEETGQIVALKLLREAYAEDPEYLARFERELELAKRIDSVNVVKVLGFGVRKRVPYLALEYVDGPSLHDSLLAHGPYSWAETRALLIQMTQGLADANAAAVIHRDVKPSNVLMGPDGVAKLTDFGIARGLDTTRMTATSTMLGTPAYLAPEGPKDARSDIYSLGVIGFQLLTGEVPFKGTTYQDVIIEHMRTPPDINRLPAEARPTIAWLLAKDPAQRPQRASALLPVLYGAAQAPIVQAAMPTAAPTVVAPGPASGSWPAPAPMSWPTQTPPPGWGGQFAPTQKPGALWAPQAVGQVAAGSIGESQRSGAKIVLVGAAMAVATSLYLALSESFYVTDLQSLALGVISLASAIALVRAGSADLRRGLGAWCAILGLVLFWNECSFLITNQYFDRFELWRWVDPIDIVWDALVAGAVVMVVGGILSAVNAGSTVTAPLPPAPAPTSWPAQTPAPAPVSMPLQTPPPGWGAQFAPASMAGAGWPQQPGFGAYRPPLGNAAARPGPAGPTVVLFGSIAVILYPLLFEYGLRVTNTTELSVLALIAAVVILINGRRATLRRGLGIGCALVGLLILWIGWSYYLSDPTYFFRVLQYRPDILVNLASEIAIVIGGVLTAATAKTSAADVKPVPFPRP